MQADLSDMVGFNYSDLILLPAGLEQAEVMRAICKAKKDSAFKLDQILNKVIQFLTSDQPALFIKLFNIYYKFKVCPSAFK